MPKNTNAASATSTTFLERLQTEALKQSYLQRYRWLPKQADVITSYIGQHTWQFLVLSSIIGTLLLQILKVSEI